MGTLVWSNIFFYINKYYVVRDNKIKTGVKLNIPRTNTRQKSPIVLKMKDENVKKETILLKTKDQQNIQNTNNSKIQILKNSGIQRFKDLVIRWFKGSEIQRFKGSSIQRFSDFMIQRSHIFNDSKAEDSTIKKSYI